MASLSMHTTTDQVVQVPALARDTALCSLARHFTLTVPLSTQCINGYKFIIKVLLGHNSSTHGRHTITMII